VANKRLIKPWFKDARAQNPPGLKSPFILGDFDRGHLTGDLYSEDLRPFHERQEVM